MLEGGRGDYFIPAWPGPKSSGWRNNRFRKNCCEKRKGGGALQGVRLAGVTGMANGPV